MKICRVIMDLYWHKSQVEAADNMWAGHIAAVRDRYQQSPEGYQHDLREIVKAAADRGAEMIIFPACTFVMDGESSLLPQKLKDLLDQFDLSAISGGILQDEQEYAFNQTLERDLLRFDARRSAVYHDQSTNIFTAISSSVKQFKSLKGYDHLGSKNLRGNQPSVVCDLGHHQYSGRYMMTLRSVKKSLVEAGFLRTSVILSYWRYRGGVSRSSWAVGADVEERIVINNSVGGTDFLDIMNFESH